MTPPTSPDLVDTNILVYALFPGVAQHVASRTLLDRAKTPSGGLCVASQSLAEFYSIVTNSRCVTSPKSPVDALTAVEDILAMPGMTVLTVPADLVTRWIALVRTRPVTGADIFDVQLVATMLANGVTNIYTYNVADFAGFPGIQALTP